LLRIGKLYGSITRNAKDLWKLGWEMSSKMPSLVDDCIELFIKEKFLRLLIDIRPDLILSVHSNYNGSVLNILKEYNINIPFVTLIADLVSIYPLWANPRADYIICPTQESKLKCLEFGVSESKLKVLGFPVRSKFCEHIQDEKGDKHYHLDRPLECLIMSGGEGSGNMSRVANILLRNFNCKINIIAGRNKVLKKRLENTLLDKYPDRVKIYGFVKNIQDLMIASDIALTRGSPNTMMEAVMCNTPLIITGALPGQEEENPEYAEKYKIGVVCTDTRKLKYVVNKLLSNNAKMLNEIKKMQREFRNPDIAKNIVEFLLSIEKTGEIDIPEFAAHSSNSMRHVAFANFRKLKTRKKVGKKQAVGNEKKY
jgi:processive 1,2-diacylglycerol beta-glucosyltransferase